MRVEAPVAVVDFETTGFSPSYGHRVLEIGVVLLDQYGQSEYEWTTLVNPGRDLGPTRVHGVTGAQVMRAPKFADVADDLLTLFQGRALVAHNAPFDMAFLQAELQRAGYDVPGRPAALCSMKWSRRTIGVAKLGEVTTALGVPLQNAHAALDDAVATAQVYTYLRSVAGQRKDWLADLDASWMFPLPRARAPWQGRCWLRTTSPKPSGDIRKSGEERGVGSPASGVDEQTFLRPGDRIVFTGEMVTSRAVWEAQVVGAGLTTGGISRSARLLVAADAYSLSSKARKAREYGVPVVDEDGFERLLQAYVKHEWGSH